MLVTALRVARLIRSMPLDDLVEKLRRAPPLRISPRDPLSFARAVARLLPLLPPYGTGPCLKRSVLLFALWSRLGLEPRIHIGIWSLPERAGGHAWLECEGIPHEFCGHGNGSGAVLVLPREPALVHPSSPRARE